MNIFVLKFKNIIFDNYKDKSRNNNDDMILMT